jgi:hypothetical protein
MKIQVRNIIMAIILGVLSPVGVRGASTSVERLNDNQLGSIRGGYCFFFKCADSADGECQPIADNVDTLCMEVSCHLELDSENGVDFVECTSPNKVQTCSENETYIRCVRTRFPALCFPDTGSNICGYQVDATCFPDIPHRRCYCDTYQSAPSCDWQSCLPTN